MRPDSNTKTVVLGDEYDDAVRTALITVLKEMGAIITDQWQALAGSQDIARLDVVLDGRDLAVETETYVGLTLSGEDELVERVARRVREMLPKPVQSGRQSA